MAGKTDDPQNDTSDFSKLLDAYNAEHDYELPQRGDIHEAEILEIRSNEIVVAMGLKRDGIIPPQDIERLNPDYLKSLKEGDVVPVYVLNPSDRDGNLLVSLNLGLQGQEWEQAQELLDSEESIDVKVTGYNQGGLLVRFGRLEGFIPASHSLQFQQGFNDDDARERAEALIGQTVSLKVIEVNQSRRRLIMSQREAEGGWRNEQKQRLMNELAVGDIVDGTVTGIRDFGVFVNLGGADGLIHVSELAWHRVPHPGDLVSVGDELKVQIIELDTERQRIALSLRRARPNPWDEAEGRYEIGQLISGTVSNVVDFGTFIVLDDGIEGLLHISEMGDGTLTEPYSYVKRGDTVWVRIVRIEADRQRIGFSQQDMGLTRPTDTPDPTKKHAEAETEPLSEESAPEADESAS